MKTLLRGLGTGILMLLLFGGIMVYQCAPKMLTSLKPSISFEDMLDGKEVKKGSHISGNVVYSLDYFASQSTYTKRQDGSRSGSRKSGNYYLIPTKESYIALKVNQRTVEEMNKLVDETFTFLENGTEPTTTVFIEGNVVPMEEKLVKYYNEYLEELGYTESEIEAMGEPLLIEYVSFNAVRIMFAIGILLIALGLFILWRRCKRIQRGSGLRRVEDIPE